jgi:hypothetical protein
MASISSPIRLRRLPAYSRTTIDGTADRARDHQREEEQDVLTDHDASYYRGVRECSLRLPDANADDGDKRATVLFNGGGPVLYGLL